MVSLLDIITPYVHCSRSNKRAKETTNACANSCDKRNADEAGVAERDRKVFNPVPSTAGEVRHADGRDKRDHRYSEMLHGTQPVSYRTRHEAADNRNEQTAYSSIVLDHGVLFESAAGSYSYTSIIVEI